MPGPRTERLELAPRSDGARNRRVSLDVDSDGGLTLLSHEMGADALAPWRDDEEVTVRIAPEDVARLAAALVTEAVGAGGTRSNASPGFARTTTSPTTSPAGVEFG